MASSIQEADSAPAGTLVYTAQFDEELDASNLDDSDVQLIGQLSGSHVPALFDYDPLTSTLTLQYESLPEDQYALTLLSNATAFTDLVGHYLDGEPLAFPLPPNKSGDGFEGGNFTVNFTTDFVIAPYPVPLAAKAPLGSLIYDPSISGVIGTPVDTDSFTIDIDDGQTITLVVETNSTLQAEVELFDPGNTSLASTVASAAGQSAVIQVVPTNGPGTYTVTVGGASGTTGSYSLQLILNSAAETETLDGLPNDTPATAQDINASFIGLGFGSAERGAVLGELPATTGIPFETEDFEAGSLDGQWTTSSSDPQGRIQVTGAYGTAAGGFALWMDRTPSGSSTLNEAIWTVDLSGITNATLSFSHAEFSDEETSLPTNFTGSVNGDGVSISDDGVNWHTVLNATSLPSGTWQPVSIDLADEAASAGMTLGTNFQIKFQQYDNFPLTTDGRGYDEIVISVPAAAEDWYQFDLADGQSATLALTAPSASNVAVELYAADGTTLLTSGIAAGNVSQVINNFVDNTTDGTDTAYFARVTGNGGDYSLLVTRDADFDTETNDDLATAQEITLPGAVLGYLGSGSIGPGTTLGLIQDSLPWGQTANNVIAAELGFNVTLIPSTRLSVTDLTAFDIVLLAGSQSDTTYGNVVASLSQVESYVSAGGVWVVNNADTGVPSPYQYDFLPGADGVVFTGATGADIDVLNPASGLIDGPGGVIDDTILDGGNWSTHGYTTSTLHVGGTAVLSTADPSQVIAFDYSFGSGHVVVHTVPVEFYDGGPHGIGQVFHRNLFGFAATVGVEFGDFYRVDANLGEVLAFQTTIPAAGPGEFVNELDIALDL